MTAEILAILGTLAVFALGLAGVALRSGRPKPRPTPPPAVLETLQEGHTEAVERIEVRAAEGRATAEEIAALPAAERNRAVGKLLRARR